jgi:manganese/zinc/iron transport system substrate-binding protein
MAVGKQLPYLLIGMVIAAAFTGCGRSPDSVPTGTESATADGKQTIVTTCGMVTDIVREVVGDRMEVVGLMGSGVDPHLFKPTRSDIQKLMDADLIFYSGLLLEGRMSDLFTQFARKGKPAFAVTEGIDESYLREPPEFAGHYDPHVWMDVSAWSQCVAFVASALGEYAPDDKEYFQANAEEYRAKLTGLEEFARDSINTIPDGQRVLVTAHDAFGYFGRAYDIDVRSVQGLTTESEAAVDDINRLVDFMVEQRIRAIFVESSVSKKNIEAIVEGARHRGWEVAIGGVLFSDAMGADGEYEGTYIGMIDHNVTAITRALGGDVPARGLHGKLKID